MRYDFPVRITLDGDKDTASRHVGEARALLGALMQDLGEADIPSGKRSRRYEGVVIDVSYDGTLGQIHITVPPPVPAPSQSVAELWIPRGFVVYPASDDSPFGWGFPIQQTTDGGATAYATANVAPGLDVTRWTVAGPLGQTLLTAVPAPIYPDLDEPLAPISWSQGVGPQAPSTPKTRPDVALDAFSFSTAASAYRPELNPYSDSAHMPAQGSRIRIFELTNTQRGSGGLDPVSLPLRGFYSPAQYLVDSANATAWFGHFAQGYWTGYQTPPDRLCKDGAPTWFQPYHATEGGATVHPSVDRNETGGISENLDGQALTFNVVGTDPHGDPVDTVVGWAEYPPDVAFASWVSSPPHLANIMDTELNGSFAFLDVGHATGSYSQDFTRRDQWIGCGNACWISQEPEIPPLSWFTFGTRNLITETEPVVWNDAGIPLSPADIAAGYSRRALVTTVPYGLTATGGANVAWFGYYLGKENADPSFPAPNFVPALSSAIYLRGRLIANAPDGLVLGAAIQKLPAPLQSIINGKPAQQMYRLVALVHVEADQPSDLTLNGLTSVLHVYTVDLPDVSGFACRGDSYVKGVRGSPISTWPWTVADDPWAWVDVGKITVSESGDSVNGPDLRNYRCLWRFNADGSKAVCLREGLSKQTQENLANQGNIGTSGVPLDAGGVDLSTLPDAAYELALADGDLDIRLLTLDIPIAAATVSGQPTSVPVLTISPRSLTNVSVYYDPPPFGINVEPPGSGVSEALTKMYPVAVDYDSSGVVQCSYIAQVDSVLSNAVDCVVMGTAPWGTPALSSLTHVSFRYLATVGDYGINYSVLDVLDSAFVIESAPAPFFSDGYDRVPIDPAFTYYPLDQPNPFYSVSVYRAGVMLHSMAYPNPDKLYNNNPALAPFITGYDLAFYVYSSYYYDPIYPQIASCMTQASYAKNRAGEWVFSYQLSPQPSMVRSQLNHAVRGDAIGYGYETLPGAPSVFDFYKLGPPSGVSPTAAMMTVTELNPRGGWMTSSFADTDALAAMTQTPGDNPRFMYARTV